MRIISKFILSLVFLTAVLGAVTLYPLITFSSDSQRHSVSLLEDRLTVQITGLMDANDTLDAVVIATSEQVLFSRGAVDLPINTHSVRKSIMSVLIGMAVFENKLSVTATLRDLDIDDAVMRLTADERQATVAHLLQARSGIYIEAAGETPEMKAARPQRGQYGPGEHYYYNNWDFNTLGAVLSRGTGVPFANYLQSLADRLGFEDYDPSHLYFRSASGSEHDQYVIFMSARDLARIGQMMLRKGADLAEQPLISPAWVAESTTKYSDLAERAPLDGYGYLWSLDSDAGTYWATGWGGQYMLVDPANDLVIVVRNDTGRRLGEIAWLVILKKSGQGRMSEVARLHELMLGSLQNN